MIDPVRRQLGGRLGAALHQTVEAARVDTIGDLVVAVGGDGTLASARSAGRGCATAGGGDALRAMRADRAWVWRGAVRLWCRLVLTLAK